MIRQEIKSLMSDKISIFILFIIPLILIAVLGVSTPRADKFATIIWIIDEDKSERSADFIDTMRNSSGGGAMLMSELAPPMQIFSDGELAPIEPKFGEENGTGVVSKELANTTLPTQYLDAYIVIPKGFQDSIAENSSARIIIYYDAINFEKRIIVQGLIQMGLTQVQLNNMIFERDVFYFPDTRPGNLLNVNLLDYAAPLFIPLMLFFSMQLVTTQSIVGDIPLKRMLNTNLRRGEVIIGKSISYAIIGVAQVLITMIAIKFFNVTMHCLWVDLFLTLVIITNMGISMGIFISTLSKTRLQASQLFLLIFFIMIVLQYFVRKPFLLAFIPLEQSKIAYSKLAFRGNSLWDAREPIFKMLLTSILFYLMGVIYIKFIKKEFV